MLVWQESLRLFVDGRYYEAAKKTVPCEVILSTQTTVADFVAENQKMQSIGFDATFVSYQGFTALQALFEGKAKVSLSPINNPLRDLRLIKDESEVAAIKKAQDLNNQGFECVCSLLKEGVTEIEVARGLEIFWIQHGGERLAFDSIIAFGENGSKPHYRPGPRALKKNEAVLIDMGIFVDHYASDMTRVVYYGEAPDKVVEIYDIVKRAKEAALALCKPGVTVANLDKAARDLISEAGYGEEFCHNLGHGVGLEVHEFPSLRQEPQTQELTLQPGMVFTIEPGIYLPNVGGVRLEDMVLITEDGYENLTNRDSDEQQLNGE